jgi:hypothetical protein
MARVTHAQKTRDLEGVDRPVIGTSRHRPNWRRELTDDIGQVLPVTLRNSSDQVSVSVAEIAILDKEELGVTLTVSERRCCQPRGPLGVKMPQSILNGDFCYFIGRRRHFVWTWRATKPSAQHSSTRVLPVVLLLQFRNTHRVGNKSEAKVMQKERTAQYKRLSRVDREVPARQDVRDFPKGINVRYVMDR